MKAWKVYNTKGKHIDTVFYDDDCTKEYVYDSLVNHDNYPESIYIIAESRKQSK